MIYYKIQLRTKSKKAVISEKSTWDSRAVPVIEAALRKQMYWWERNSHLYHDDPLEVVTEEEKGY